MRRTTWKALLATAIAVPGLLTGGAAPAVAAASALQQVAPVATLLPSAPVEFSVTGDVTASATVVDAQIPAGPVADSTTSGCDAADFAGFPAGTIAVLQRGTCTIAVKAATAQAAGAVAVVIFNEGQPGRTDVFQTTLGGSGVVTVPVVTTSFAAGLQLWQLAPAGLILRVAVTAGDPPTCSPPAVGTPVGGKNVVLAQPGSVTLGTEGPDVIYGTEGDDRIAALGGDDIVFGLGGNDRITGGDGADVACGGAGNDLIDGGADDDLLVGGGEHDDLTGAGGADTILGGAGTNRLLGGEGTDACAEGTALACETATV
jgi:Ca2+-binding RTX toxin-like protein